LTVRALPLQDVLVALSAPHPPVPAGPIAAVAS